ncbi:MAG: acetate--CoA ligase family protein [Gemmatimonadales bacterium]|nr:MAG: acetate--CoA ligase family protein [Gemmatimonadales bacterium]
MDDVAGRVPHSLEPLFAPRSVAVVGASREPSKRGFQIVRALSESRYRGAVYPVNPRGGELLGFPVYAAVADLPEVPDLAVICTPAASVPEIMSQCGQKGIRGALVLAVGFGESGPAGRELEDRALAAAREHGIRILGPNTSGLLNLPLGLNLIGARGVRTGHLSLLVQSGNVALGLMKEATERSWAGVAVCAGIGNGRDVGFAESLEFLARHGDTRAILCHLEGVQDIRRFLAAASHATRTTPVVVLKAGRSRAGAEAARSHTGSVAGPYEWLRAGLRQAGVTEVLRTDELLHVGETLAWQPLPGEGRGALILSDGGGQGTLATDILTEWGIPLAVPGSETRARLRALLGDAAAVGNPVDLAGAADANPEIFARALEVVAEDPEVGGVLLVGLFGGYALRFDDVLRSREEEAAVRMGEAMKRHGKPLVVHTMFALERTPPLAALGEARVPVVASLEVACRCLESLWSRGVALRSSPWLDRPGSGDGPATTPPEIAAARAEGRDTLTETETRSLLSGSGLALPPAVLCTGEDEAVKAATELGDSVVLKVVSPHISHKSEAGGVALGCRGEDAVRAAFREVLTAAERYLDAAGLPQHVDGVLVTPMLEPPLTEVLVGAARDPDLGPVLSVGAGGIWVEVHRDVVHRVLPVEAAEVRAALEELRIHPILAGHRGQGVADMDTLVEAVSAVARCLLEHEELSSVEVNPLFVYRDGVAPVDARAFLRQDPLQDLPRATPSA